MDKNAAPRLHNFLSKLASDTTPTLLHGFVLAKKKLLGPQNSILYRLVGIQLERYKLTSIVTCKILF